MRLLFIGQAPSRETDGQPPFVGKCGAFLAGLLGVTQDQMLRDHDFLNVFDRWPGKGIGGDKFPIPEAKIRVAGMLGQLRDRTTILLGANVARAFGADKFEYLRWYEVRDPADPRIVVCERAAIVPHPSGRNRWFNPRANREVARKFFEGILRK